MRIIAAYLLSVLAGNEKPTVESIQNLFDAVGIEESNEKIAEFLKEVQGKVRLAPQIEQKNDLRRRSQKPTRSFRSAIGGNEAAVAQSPPRIQVVGGVCNRIRGW